MVTISLWLGELSNLEDDWIQHQRGKLTARECLHRSDGAAHYRHYPQGLWRRLCVMNVKHIHCDINYVWPTAEIAVLGARGASEVIYRRKIEKAGDQEAKLNGKMENYRQRFMNPFVAAKRGYIADVIFPRNTKHRLIRTLQFLESKKPGRPDRKHGNITL